MLLYFVLLCKMAARELICIFLLMMKVSIHRAHQYQQLSTQPYTYYSPTYEYSPPHTSDFYASYSPSTYHSSYTSQCLNPQPYDTTTLSPLDASPISSSYHQSNQPVSSFSTTYVTAPSPSIDVQTYLQPAQTAASSSSYYQYSPSASITSSSLQSCITTTSSSDISSTTSNSDLPSYYTTTSAPLAAPLMNSVSYVQSSQPVSSYQSSYATSAPVQISYVKPDISHIAPSPHVTVSCFNDLSSMASVSYIEANPSVLSPVKTTDTNHSTYPPPNQTSQPKCTMISRGKIIEIPCYTVPTEPKKALPTEVLPVEASKPLMETTISHQPPQRSSQNPSVITAEPIPHMNLSVPYPCPLCSALKNSNPKNVESSLMPPPAPSPLIPGILNDIPSTFPRQKKISSVKSNKPQKPNLQEGPLIYLPISDEGKLLEKLLKGLGY